MSRFLHFFCLTLAFFLVGCGLFRDDIHITFEGNENWNVPSVEGVRGSVQDGRFLFETDWPDSVFWSAAGAPNFEDGQYDVTISPVAGSTESAGGLFFRADPADTAFYYFMVSTDGFYTAGGCFNECSATEDFIPMTKPTWQPSDAINAGIGQTNQLRVIARGAEMQFFINETEIAQFSEPNLQKGDLGFIMQTFDAGATIAFDELHFTPSE